MDALPSIDFASKNPRSEFAMSLAEAKAGETFFVYSGEGLFATLQIPEFYYKTHYYWRRFSERSWMHAKRVKEYGCDSLPLFTFTSDARIELKFGTYADGETVTLPSIRADTTIGTLDLVDCGICPDPISGLWSLYNIPVLVTKERLQELQDWLEWWRALPCGWPYVEALSVLLGGRHSTPCPF